MQILADRIEFCWIHLEGIGTLENSLWGYDGHGIRLWLDALTLENTTEASSAGDFQVAESVQESVNIPLSFYPLCKRLLYSPKKGDDTYFLRTLAVLMDKGIIIGVEHEIATRGSLPFVMFRLLPTVRLSFRVASHANRPIDSSLLASRSRIPPHP
jgi:hypothetical protein